MPADLPGASRAADPEYLRFQYGDDERLRVRMATHARYSENPVHFPDWLVARIGVGPGLSALDVGSGPGQFHERLAPMRIVAVDLFRGMLAKVRVPRAQADTQALPFRDSAFERVLCAHVLFHVPDIPLALREMRRVTRPGGRVIIATNSRHSMRPLSEIQNAVARELGIAEEFSVALRFGLEDADVVRAVFPSVRVDVYADAFRFTAVEPVLAYVAFMSVGTLPLALRSEFLARLAERVQAAITADGVFRVPKRSGCFVATV